MSRPSAAPRNLTLTEELEKLEQSITLTLQEIDHNFSKAHRIVTASILPVVESYGEHSKDVWEASKFWKQFFEASANVSLSGYEELANDQDDTTNAEETTVQEDLTGVYNTPRTGGRDDMTLNTPAGESTFQTDVSLLNDDELTGSTPRAPSTRTVKANYSNLESPYEALKRELKGEPPAPDAEDDGDELEEEDSTVLFAQHTARLPDMSMTPRSLLPQPQQRRRTREPNTASRRSKTEDEGQGKSKGKENIPSWQDSPMSSPVMEAPKLRSEAFMSPIKSAARQRLAAATAGPRTPGVSVQTPASTRRTKDFFPHDDDTTTTTEAPVTRQKYEIDWDSDSDEGAFGGMSPPKTIQFALPPSKLLQTPAREASKRIVDDILMTAGAEPDSSEYSPTMVKMNDDVLNDSF
ncbi:DASH complex subunit ask1 like protein [Verticillium longisporum]|uniref:DASH complex subunit ASK1 n=1 Tax=Verticillium longisporum TaxID=100787 RepID=A0A8I2ZKY6_VERLO|nr:DASH complex subunit ask1 like protein [Verticillium longisporum]